MATSLVAQEHAGGALLLVAGALVPVVLSPRDGPAWPLSAGAPALGAIGLACAWPGVAGLTGPIWRRAMLGATGWIWLALARASYAASTDRRFPSRPNPAGHGRHARRRRGLGGGRDRASVGRDPALAGARGDAVGGLGGRCSRWRRSRPHTWGPHSRGYRSETQCWGRLPGRSWRLSQGELGTGWRARDGRKIARRPRSMELRQIPRPVRRYNTAGGDIWISTGNSCRRDVAVHL